MYRRILVPTDGSAGAAAAVEQAVALAAAVDAELHGLYVIRTDLSPDAALPGVVDEFEAVGEAALADVRARAEAAGLGAVETALVQGRAHRQILAYVDDHDVDLVVLGTRGLTGLERYLLGSVAEKVIRMADVPVLAVPTPAES